MGFFDKRVSPAEAKAQAMSASVNGPYAAAGPAWNVSAVDLDKMLAAQRHEAERYLAIHLGSIQSSAGQMTAGYPTPNGDIRITIHPATNGYTVIIGSGGGSVPKEWVCPDGASLIDIIAVALAEYNLTK